MTEGMPERKSPSNDVRLGRDGEWGTVFIQIIWSEQQGCAGTSLLPRGTNVVIKCAQGKECYYTFIIKQVQAHKCAAQERPPVSPLAQPVQAARAQATVHGRGQCLVPPT
jgi:hypothetical protein